MQIHSPVAPNDSRNAATFSNDSNSRGVIGQEFVSLYIVRCGRCTTRLHGGIQSRCGSPEGPECFGFRVAKQLQTSGTIRSARTAPTLGMQWVIERLNTDLSAAVGVGLSEHKIKCGAPIVGVGFPHPNIGAKPCPCICGAICMECGTEFFASGACHCHAAFFAVLMRCQSADSLASKLFVK